MIAASRRRILSFIGAAPLGGLVSAESAAVKLSGLAMLPNGKADPSPDTVDATADQCAAAMRNKLLRRQIESMLYEQEKRVCCIDPDIAVMRSFSLSAKVTFQRQRNVEKRMEDMALDYPWRRLNRFILSAFKVGSQ